MGLEAGAFSAHPNLPPVSGAALFYPARSLLRITHPPMFNDLTRESTATTVAITARSIVFAICRFIYTYVRLATAPDYEGREHDRYILNYEISAFAEWVLPFTRNRCKECGGYTKVWWRSVGPACPHYDDVPF